MKLESRNLTRWRSLVAYVVLIVTMLACSPLAPTPSPVPTATSTPRLPTTTPTESPTPTATTPPPTATPTVAQCPPPGTPELIQPANFADYAAAVRQFLSAGGGVGTLRDKLAEWGALLDEPGQVTEADLTGDGASEVIVALVRPDAQIISPPGDLLIFGCDAGAYTLMYHAGRPEEDFAPTVVVNQVSDANGSGLPDVVYVQRTCGAHTCFETLKVVGWDGTALVNLMGGELTMPYPSYTVTSRRIEAQSGGIGSVGAEPQRGYSEIWEWNGSVFTVTETVYEPPTYRYHALLDGDRALLDGDYETALATYQRVIDDDALEEWGGISSGMAPAEERAFLSAFARWRLALTPLQMGDVSDAQAAYNRLQAEHPPGDAGHDVAAMAEMFWSAYLADDSVAAGCSAVVAGTDEDDPILQFFNQNYGYANPWWEPQDLCPFVE